MKIVLDAMGGDHAPQEIVRGGAAAARELGVEVVLVGREEEVRAGLGKGNPVGPRLSVLNASQVVTMGEHPVSAISEKRDSSIVVGMNLLKKGEASAFVSAGNTGAIVAAALLTLGRTRGIHRPALSAIFPFPAGPVLILDLGANAECKPASLVQFAHMGSVYMERVFSIPSPRVGLLSNGVEQIKGNQLVRQTHELLRHSSLNFIGNVEARDTAAGVADVIVTDGFTGNVLLKMGEGLGQMVLHHLREDTAQRVYRRLGALLLRHTLKRVIHTLDYTEHGGGLLLGVNGNVVICHGSSNAKAIKSAIAAAKRAVAQRVVEAIRGE